MTEDEMINHIEEMAYAFRRMPGYSPQEQYAFRKFMLMTMKVVKHVSPVRQMVISSDDTLDTFGGRVE